MNEQVSTTGETLSKKDDIKYREFKRMMEEAFPNEFDPVLAENDIKFRFRWMTIMGVMGVVLSIPFSFILVGIPFFFISIWYIYKSRRDLKKALWFLDLYTKEMMPAEG